MKKRIGKKNVVKAEYCNYAKLFNGTGGIGKTTMFFDITKKLYGEEGGLLITVGEEPRPDHIPNAYYEEAPTWDDLEEVIDILCEERNEDYSHIKEIGIDSIDEVYRLAEHKVIQMHNRKHPEKKVDSIKQCFGGFQAGEDKVVDIVTCLLFKLRKYGYGITIIGHSKIKNKKDEMNDIEFEVLTSDLPAKYYNAIKNKVNLVGVAYVEREYTDLQTMKDAFTKGNKQKGRISSEKRVISFRDEEYATDNKSHFPDIVAKCDFNAESVIKAITDAINAQLSKQFGSTVNVEEVKKQQAEEVVVQVKALNRDEMLDKIKSKFAQLDQDVKESISNIVKKDGATNLLEASDKALESIVKLIG
jgi:hypothetical protein